MQVAERMTADEYLAIEDKRWGTELIAGEVVVEQAGVEHQRIARTLLFELETWTRASAGRGEVMLPLDVKLDDRNVFAPDIMWYPDGPGDSRPSPLPALAIEVRSPTTWRYDVGHKRALYEAHSLPELWLADTVGATVLVFRRSRPGAPTFDVALEPGRGERLTSPLLPGFELALHELFPG